VSVIKLKDIEPAAQGTGCESGFVVHVEVLGRNHTIACEVKSDVRPDDLLSDSGHTQDDEAGTRVIIAPYLSPEAQALCKASHAGFLDLEGNARIALGEVFIGKQSVAHRRVHPLATSHTKATALVN